MNEDGTLVPIDDSEIIEITRSYGTSPVMLLSSLGVDGRFSNNLVSTVLNNPAARGTLINSIVQTMLAKRYDAVDVDFEYVLPEDKEIFIQFINELRAASNARGKQVFIALAPKTSADQRGLLYEAHDYGALGEAANKVLLMTYEWGYTYGPPMAVAPINMVERVVNYALTEIPADKIFMGIPNYAYDWQLPYVSGESRATSISNTAAVTLAGDTGSEIMFDETAQTPFFVYTDDMGNKHEVWFEDARSILAKLNLVLDKNLFGAAVWQVMRYFQQLWMVINANTNIRRTGDEALTNIF